MPDTNDRIKSRYPSDRGACANLPGNRQMDRDFDDLPTPRKLSGVQQYRQGDIGSAGGSQFKRKKSGS